MIEIPSSVQAGIQIRIGIQYRLGSIEQFHKLKSLESI